MANNKPITEEELARAEKDPIFLDTLARRLRGKCNVHIEVQYDYEYDSTPYHYYIRHFGIGESRTYEQWKSDYPTYEEALLAGIKEHNDSYNND